MSVRAKFVCSSNNNGVVSMHPVYSGSEENKAFWNATLGGSIALSITNQEAAKQFEAGKEYYVDFTPATYEYAGEYVPPTSLNFGQALEAMNNGSKVSRAGWNGKGMWIAKSGTGEGEGGGRVNDAADFWNPHAKAFAEANGGTAEVLPLVIMKTADGKILMGWLASQSDMFATDWGVVD